MDKKILRVWLQLTKDGLQSISRRVVTTAVRLSLEGDCRSQGVVFTDRLSEPAKELLKGCGLDEVLVWEGPAFGGFLPEVQAEILSTLPPCQVLLFPATPEGRTLSSMTAARLRTGSTADCTALSWENGLLKQTRPAFSGARMASILTEQRKPQIASLRFGMPVPKPEKQTLVTVQPWEKPPAYETAWLDRPETEEALQEVLLVLGGGIRRQEDIPLMEELARKLGADLLCSRALVDRGWMPKSRQIGLSGRSVSPRLLIALGVSGSVQFQAGLGEVGHLLAVDENPDTPLMRLADTPIQGDLYEITKELL